MTRLSHCKENTVFFFFQAQISIKHHLQIKQLQLSRLKVTHAVIRLIQGGLHNRYSSCQHQVTTSILRHKVDLMVTEAADMRVPSFVWMSWNHMSVLGLEPHWNSVETSGWRVAASHSRFLERSFVACVHACRVLPCRALPVWPQALDGYIRWLPADRDAAVMSLSCYRGMTSCVLSAADSTACLCYILPHAFTRSSSITSPACRRSF